MSPRRSTGARALLPDPASTGAFVDLVALVPGEFRGVSNCEVNAAGALVGLSTVAGTEQWHVVTVDADTGVVASLAALPPFGGLSQGNGAYDPATDRMFEVTGDGRLLVIDAGTGALVDSVALAAGVGELEVNAAGELVGLTQGDGEGQWVVVRVEPQTGELTALAALPPQAGIVQGVGGFDPGLDRMFVQGDGAVVLGIDAATGALASTTTIVAGTHDAILNPELVP